MKKRSSAWKDFERSIALEARIAGFSRAYRVHRGDDIGVSATDIIIPELPFIKIDAKYRSDGFHHHALFLEAERKYCKTNSDFMILPTKGGHERGSLSTVRTDVLFNLLAKTHLDQEKPVGALGCPFCKGIAMPNSIGLNLSECVCTSCQGSYIIRTDDVPATATMAAYKANLPPSLADMDYEETVVGESPLEISVADTQFLTSVDRPNRRPTGRGRKKHG